MGSEQNDKENALQERLKSIEQRLNEVQTKLLTDEARLDEDELQIKTDDAHISTISRRVLQLYTGVKVALHRIQLVASMAAGIWLAVWARLFVIGRYQGARVRVVSPATTYETFWTNLPKETILFLWLAASALGAVVGFLGVWLLCKLIAWLLFGSALPPEE
ncbi:MAG: hypothetical protein JXB29_11625 [Sedimentisphaerales bacterium]|nr:hypothetical protein [Sedimentisphaerales bacterium]